MQRIKDGESAEDRGDDGNGLWNAQPFKQPPAVPLPECPAGCIRAHPVLVRVPSLLAGITKAWHIFYQRRPNPCCSFLSMFHRWVHVGLARGTPGLSG